jgi:hypothetical protein
MGPARRGGIAFILQQGAYCHSTSLQYNAPSIVFRGSVPPRHYFSTRPRAYSRGLCLDGQLLPSHNLSPSLDHARQGAP